MPANPPFVIHVSEMVDFPDAVYIGRENGRKRLKRSKWAKIPVNMRNPGIMREAKAPACLHHPRHGT